MAGKDAFNFDAWKELLGSQDGQNVLNGGSPELDMLQKISEQFSKDPTLMKMMEEIQGSVQGDGQPDITKYMDAMTKLFTNDDYLKKAEELGNMILQTNPEITKAFQGIMNQAHDPTMAARLEQVMQGIQKDAEYKPFVEMMEKDPSSAFEWLQKHPELMNKYNDQLRKVFDLNLASMGEKGAAEESSSSRDAGGDEEYVDLHAAASEGDPKLVKELILNGANVDEADDEGRTALHFACGYGEVECSKLLIKHNANINATDNNQNTPLHYAAGYGQARTVDLLLRHHADLDAKNQDGNSPLEVAQLNEHTDVVQLLQKAVERSKVKGLGGKGL